MEKENKIKSMINNGNFSNCCLFQTITIITIDTDVKANFWYFLEENEDDIEKILTINYDYIMIISIPLNYDKSIIIFIFYDEKK